LEGLRNNIFICGGKKLQKGQFILRSMSRVRLNPKAYHIHWEQSKWISFKTAFKICRKIYILLGKANCIWCCDLWRDELQFPMFLLSWNWRSLKQLPKPLSALCIDIWLH